MLRWLSNTYRWLVGDRVPPESQPETSPDTPAASTEIPQSTEIPATSAETLAASTENPAASMDSPATSPDTTAESPSSPQESLSQQSPEQPSEDEEGAIDYFNNEHREKADEEDRLMRECYDKATEARERGDHGSASQYVEEAKKHKAEKKAAHKRGRDYVLNNNPTNSKKDVVDLHGLRVDEALEVVEERIDMAKELGYKEFHIITGRGNHSINNQPKIKPKIKDFLNGKKYKFEEDKDNPGSMTVFLKTD